MSIFFDNLKEGSVIYGTDNLATEFAKKPEAQPALQKDGVKIAEADKAINALFQFCTDCGYVLKLNNNITIYDDKLTFSIILRVYDSDDMDTYGFSLIASIYEAGFGGGLRIKIRDMYDHIVETRSNSKGWTSNTRKHPISFLGTKFGASKACSNEYWWSVDNFVKNLPAMIKYFKKSNTLGKYKSKNEEIVHAAQKTARKMDIQKTKINAFVNELEGFVENIDPNLHVYVKELGGDVKTTNFTVSIYNSMLEPWANRYYWYSNNNRAALEEIFSEEGCYSDMMSFYTNRESINAAKRKIEAWLEEINDPAKAEYTKLLETEAKKPLGVIPGIFSTNKEYISKFTYNGEYSTILRSGQCTIAFSITYNASDDNWQICYRGLSGFPSIFRKFLDNADKVSKNPADLIKYVELVYKVSQKANDYANKVLALTKAAKEDLKA